MLRVERGCDDPSGIPPDATRFLGTIKNLVRISTTHSLASQPVADLDEFFDGRFTVGAVDDCLEYVNGGHDQPMRYRCATGEVVDLDSTGMELGVFRGLGYRVNMEHTLEVGDVLLMTTDGAWECRNNDNMVFGCE